MTTLVKLRTHPKVLDQLHKTANTHTDTHTELGDKDLHCSPAHTQDKEALETFIALLEGTLIQEAAMGLTAAL